MEDDFEIVCSKIDEEKDYLNVVSQEIWRNPELGFKEFHAHTFLTNALSKYGFKVEKHYILNTAFKAEYTSKREESSGPTVAILLEYDALPDIGHACGHNLISECGLAAAIAVKEVMQRDPTVHGRLIVMGTPAEEGGGGKIKLIEKGAFEEIDVALMAHPTSISCTAPPMLCNLRGSIEFLGKEAHAASSPWNGINALDAAVLCYNNLSVLRQQIRPNQRIHVIIQEGGVATNIIPAKSRLAFAMRTHAFKELKELRSKVESCINGAATATGCKVNYQFEDSTSYLNLISNKILINLYKKYFEKLGMTFNDGDFTVNTGSTDMGNVSHIVPAYHPFYAIPTKAANHTKEYTDAAGLPTAQVPTLIAAKAMAMTAVSVLRNSDVLKEVKEQFKKDISEN